MQALTITNIIVNPYRGDGQLFIYPQPTKNNIIVEYESMMDGIVHMEFYNLLGELLLRFDDPVSQGWNKFNYNISNLSDVFQFELLNFRYLWI